MISSHLSHVMTLANGIIGVSVLAMPFCFKQCGIILATLVLLMSCLLSRLACHFLVKSAVMSRRRNFELLAFHAFGKMGKFTVELFIIGFLVGTCIAFFVVVGDLSPQIIGKLIDRNPEEIRTSLLVTTGAFIVLPLGLLRNIDSLSTVCTATIGFYFCLIMKVIGESTQRIFSGDWYDHVYYWRPAGILQCLPIFSMALFCQTQLFAIYEAIPNVSLEKMNRVVRGALNICTLVYLCVGFFGYIAFCKQPFSGNILMSLEPNLSSEMIKMGFVFSVAFSFPLVIFPCRASLNSLLFRRVYTHEPSSTYMPETRFRCLTFSIVCISLMIGILIPNIEFVLGLLGSTIGVMICLIFPAAFFISISSKNTNERLVAHAILFVGVWIMVLGTYANLYAMEESIDSKNTIVPTNPPLHQINNLPINIIKGNMPLAPDVAMNPKIISNVKEKFDNYPDAREIRQEPPVPLERVVVTKKVLATSSQSVAIVASTFTSNVKTAVERMKTLDQGLKRDSRRVEKGSETNGITSEPVVIAETKTNVKPSERKEYLIESQKIDKPADVDGTKKKASESASFDREIAADRREALWKISEKRKLERLQMTAEQKESFGGDIKVQKEESEGNKENAIANKLGNKGMRKERNEEKNYPIAMDDSLIRASNTLGKDGLIERNNNEEQGNVVDKNVQSSWSGNNEKHNESEKRKGLILNALTKNISKALSLHVDESSGARNSTKSKDEDIEGVESKHSNNAERWQVSYRMPIPLTLQNQTKIPQVLLPSPTEITAKNVQAIGRDILENREREKREVDESKEKYNSKVSSNLMTREMDLDTNDERIECQREERGISDESVRGAFKADGEPYVLSTERTLIKTNVYLSDQQFPNNVFVDGENVVKNVDYLKIQERDLKFMKINDNDVEQDFHKRMVRS